MLGQKQQTAPLNPKDSNLVRRTAYRMATGQLNDTDYKTIAHFNRLRDLNRNRFVWK